MHESLRPEQDPYSEAARQLIDAEVDPIIKAGMMNAAIDEGMPLGVDELLGVIGEISDEDERAPDRVTPYERQTYIAKAAVDAFANQERFTETGPLLNFLKARSSYSYLEGVIVLLEHGYAGPNNDLLQFTTAEIADMVVYDPDAARTTPSPIHNNDARIQQFYLELYLRGAAHMGANITEADSNFQHMFSTFMELSKSLHQEPWQTQRMMTTIGRAYAEGGHIDSALEWKDRLADHTLRASLAVDIMERAKNPELSKKLTVEVDGLMVKTMMCDGECGHKYCNPERDVRELFLKRLKLEAQTDRDGALDALLRIKEPQFYFPDKQLEVYLEIYKSLGGDDVRKYSLSILNDLNHHRKDYLAGVIKQVAEADIKWNKTLSFPDVNDEPVPLIAWEVEKVYWGIDKYRHRITGEDMGDMEFVTKHDRGGPAEDEIPYMRLLGMNTGEEEVDAFGPLSASFSGDPAAIEADLRHSQEQRDRAFVTIATLLVGQGLQAAADYFLRKVDAQDEKVRGLVAVGRESAR